MTALRGGANGDILAVRPIGELKPLTGLRGVAALYVVCLHYFGLSAYTTPLKRILGHGYLAVDLFFVLSGLVMALNYGRFFAHGWSRAAYFTFLGRRIARIYPLYLVATLVGFAFVLVGWLGYRATVPLGAALGLSALMVQAWGFAPSFDSPAWSLSAEWAAYLMFPALVVPALFRSPRVGWICALTAAGVLAGLCSLPASVIPAYLVDDPLNMPGYWLALPVVRCVAEFTLGIVAFRLMSTPIGRRAGSSRWLAPMLCAVTVALLALPKSDLAVVLLLPLLVLSAASESNVLGRLLAAPAARLAGKLSFSFYLTHMLPFGLLNRLYSGLHAAGIHHAQTYAALTCMALTLVMTVAAYRCIEVPGRRWLRGVFVHPSSRPMRGGGTTPTAART